MSTIVSFPLLLLYFPWLHGGPVILSKPLSLSVRTFHFKKRRSDRNRQESSRITSLSFKYAVWSLFVVHRSFVLVKNYTISITLQNLRLTKDTYVSYVMSLPFLHFPYFSPLSSRAINTARNYTIRVAAILMNIDQNDSLDLSIKNLLI